MVDINGSFDKKEKINGYIASLFPEHIKIACKNYLDAYSGITEIRLRLNSPLSFTHQGSNLITGIKCTREDIAYCLEKMTQSNYMKFEDMMRRGYITLLHGCRAGVCGDVFVQDGKIKILRSINYINIRIPSTVRLENKELLDYLKKSDYSASVLVISPPGVGKTTVLKNIACSLSTPPVSKRVAVVDTKHELLLPHEKKEALCDYLSGYPKADGIMIAASYFNPEYIICDEIGEYSEAEAICSLQHSGVPFIASAHAKSFKDVRLRKNINLLLENQVFDAVMRLYRIGQAVYSEIKPTEELLK
jgi:stage III sporulation protein AA